MLVSNYTCRVLLDLQEAVVEEANIDDFTFEIMACQTGVVENLDLLVTETQPETNVKNLQDNGFCVIIRR